MNWINMALNFFLSRETLSRNKKFSNVYLCVILRWYSKPLIFSRFFYIVFLVINILRHGLVIQYRVSIWRPIYRLIHLLIWNLSFCNILFLKNIWPTKHLQKNQICNILKKIFFKVIAGIFPSPIIKSYGSWY